MAIAALIVVVVLGMAVLIIGGVLVGVRLIVGSKESLSARYPDAVLISRGANFYGQESKGAGQMRGNGHLILTGSELVFEMWVPKQVMRIPLSQIQNVDNPKSFLGKSQGRPLLQVSYLDYGGGQDSMAWLLRDVDEMTRALAEQRG